MASIRPASAIDGLLSVFEDIIRGSWVEEYLSERRYGCPDDSSPAGAHRLAAPSSRTFLQRGSLCFLKR